MYIFLAGLQVKCCKGLHRMIDYHDSQPTGLSHKLSLCQKLNRHLRRQHWNHHTSGPNPIMLRLYMNICIWIFKSTCPLAGGLELPFSYCIVTAGAFNMGADDPKPNWTELGVFSSSPCPPQPEAHFPTCLLLVVRSNVRLRVLEI